MLGAPLEQPDQYPDGMANSLWNEAEAYNQHCRLTMICCELLEKRSTRVTRWSRGQRRRQAKVVQAEKHIFGASAGRTGPRDTVKNLIILEDGCDKN